MRVRSHSMPFRSTFSHNAAGRRIERSTRTSSGGFGGRPRGRLVGSFCSMPRIVAPIYRATNKLDMAYLTCYNKSSSQGAEMIETKRDEQRLYKVPALFWLDHEDRHPCDRPEQMAELQSIQGRVAYIMANDEQLECLRSDAEFYAGDNVDDCPGIQRSARATLVAIAKALESKQ